MSAWSLSVVSVQAAATGAAAPGGYAPFLVILPLLAWRIYARSRRVVGRQRFSAGRSWVTVVVYTVLIPLIGLAALAHPTALIFLAIGLALGVGLGFLGFSKTRFESTAEGRFYTPHAHIGMAITIVFVARIGYRFFEVYQAQQSGSADPAHFAHSPLTLGVFGLLAGYFVTYAIGLLRWSARASLPGQNTVQ